VNSVVNLSWRIGNYLKLEQCSRVWIQLRTIEVKDNPTWWCWLIRRRRDFHGTIGRWEFNCQLIHLSSTFTWKSLFYCFPQILSTIWFHHHPPSQSPSPKGKDILKFNSSFTSTELTTESILGFLNFMLLLLGWQGSHETPLKLNRLAWLLGSNRRGAPCKTKPSNQRGILYLLEKKKIKCDSAVALW